MLTDNTRPANHCNLLVVPLTCTGNNNMQVRGEINPPQHSRKMALTYLSDVGWFAEEEEGKIKRVRSEGCPVQAEGQLCEHPGDR